MNHSRSYLRSVKTCRISSHFFGGESIGLLVSLFIGLTTSFNMHADKELMSSINKFSAAFLSELGSKTSVVSSPLSAEMILALVSAGANCHGKSEIHKVLKIYDENALQTGLKAIGESLNEISSVTFKMATKIYVSSGARGLNKNFANTAKHIFHTDMEVVDFVKNQEAARIINKWVESRTNNKIKDLISAETLDSTTQMVAANVMYFKGLWLHKFPTAATKNGDFHVTAGKTVTVPFMNVKNRFNYTASAMLDAKIVELPYKDKEASMIVIVPNKMDGLAAVLEKLKTYNLQDALDEMSTVEVEVRLPKFKIETKTDLKEVLIKMGLTSIFHSENGGVLTEMMDNNGEPLVVSHAVQKVFIEVNEEGSEAAAASGMTFVLFSAPLPPLKLAADRPFLAFLRVGNLLAFAAAVAENFTF